MEAAGERTFGARSGVLIESVGLPHRTHRGHWSCLLSSLEMSIT
jgi:hypothetical protein